MECVRRILQETGRTSLLTAVEQMVNKQPVVFQSSNGYAACFMFTGGGATRVNVENG